MPFIGFSVDNALLYKSPVINGLQLDIETSFGGTDGGGPIRTVTAPLRSLMTAVPFVSSPFWST